MLLACLMILITTAVLLWMGTIAPPLAIALIVTAVIALILMLLKRLRRKIILVNSIRKNGYLWGSWFYHLGGMLMPVNSVIHLYLDRQEQLIIEADQTTRTVPLQQLGRLLMMRGDQVLHVSDQTIFQLLQIQNSRALNAVRDLLERNRQVRHRELLLMHMLPQSEVLQDWGELIVLINGGGRHHLMRFLKRPEIIVKARISRLKGKERDFLALPVQKGNQTHVDRAASDHSTD